MSIDMHHKRRVCEITKKTIEKSWFDEEEEVKSSFFKKLLQGKRLLHVLGKL